MADQEEKRTANERGRGRFSTSTLSAMQKNYLFYFSTFILVLIVFYCISMVFLIDLSPIIHSLYEEHGEELMKQQLLFQVTTVVQLFNQQKNAFFHAVCLLSASEPVIQSLSTEIHDDVRSEISQIFYSNAGFQQLDYFYILDHNSRVVLSTALGHKTGGMIYHDPIAIQVLSGQSASYLGMATTSWLEETGYGLMQTTSGSTTNSLQSTVGEGRENSTLLVLESGSPIYRDKQIVGVFIGGVFLNNDRKFFENIHRTLWGAKGTRMFLSLIIDNERILSTHLTETGSLEKTRVIDSSFQRELQRDEIFFRNDLIDKELFTFAYSPLKDSRNQSIAAVEVAYSQQNLTQSYDRCYQKLRVRIYLSILFTSLIAFFIARFLAQSFSVRFFDPLRTMTQQISMLIAKIAEASQKIKNTSSEILAASEEQSAYASEQSASINETTATMEELATVTKQIANYAEQVVNVAQQTTDNAEKGYKSVVDTISSMKEIKKKNETSANEILSLGEKSQKIGQVMRFINSIASQTKLIAFNASIEASAAGEIGKRFGVVATEVRRLAENVVRSTDEIKRIITEIQKSTNRLVFVSEEETKKIDDGVFLSENSGIALQEILKIVTKTNQAAKQISLITQQQRTASDQVVAALKEISVGAGESVRANKNINTAINQLDDLSEELNNLLSESAFFNEKKEV